MSSSMKRNIQEIYGSGGGASSNGNSNGSSIGSNLASSSNGNHHHHQLQHTSSSAHHPSVQIDPNATQESKKSRLEQQIKQESSRVVHLRNIPQQLTDQEICFLGLHFGHILNVLFLRAKNQAFLEFEHVADAQKMIAHFAVTATTFSGKKVFVQYSNHQSLNTDPNNASNLAAQNSLNEAVSLYRAAREGNKSTVLRATILNMLYPVTLDVLTQIFSKFGPIVKMITFNKNDKFQALVQMRDPMAANNAKMSLNGQNIYTGCCTIQIDYSKLTNLEVRYNNDKSRDFTNPMLPTGEGQHLNETNSMGSGSTSISNSSQSLNNGTNLQMGGGSGSSSSQQMQPSYQQAQQSLIGNPPGMFSSQHSAALAVAQMAAVAGNPFNAQNSLGMMNNMYQQSGQQQQQSYMGVGMGMGPPMVGGMQPQVSQNQQSQQMPQPGQTSVILVSNLNEEFVNTDALFTLFGVYGDVTRVKILFNKKDSALINFANPQQAATALSNLDRAKLWGKQIRVFASKHTTVQMPKEGQPDSGLTKDYSTSPLHRFKKPGSKNFNNIFPPSATLHLSNIPPNVTEQQLRELFQQYGTIKAFKFFQKDRKMALIQMGSAEEATHALIGTHNHQLAENMHLRCTFSKATV